MPKEDTGRVIITDAQLYTELDILIDEFIGTLPVDQELCEFIGALPDGQELLKLSDASLERVLLEKAHEILKAKLLESYKSSNRTKIKYITLVDRDGNATQVLEHNLLVEIHRFILNNLAAITLPHNLKAQVSELIVNDYDNNEQWPAVKIGAIVMRAFDVKLKKDADIHSDTDAESELDPDAIGVEEVEALLQRRAESRGTTGTAHTLSMTSSFPPAVRCASVSPTSDWSGRQRLRHSFDSSFVFGGSSLSGSDYWVSQVPGKKEDATTKRPTTGDSMVRTPVLHQRTEQPQRDADDRTGASKTSRAKRKPYDSFSRWLGFGS